MRLLTATLIFLFTASTYAVNIEKMERSAGEALVKSKTCDMQISFVSEASGINREAFRKITAFVESSAGLKKAHIWYWGKEGERDICLELNDKKQMKKIENQLRELASLKIVSDSAQSSQLILQVSSK